MIPLVFTPYIIAGTFRDDFENENDFLKDKQLREGGVWGEDVDFFTWENGAIKGLNRGAGWPSLLLITGDYGWKDYTVECRAKAIIIDNEAFMGLVLRRPCIDCDPYYAFSLAADKAFIHPADNKWDPLMSVPFQTKLNTWYALKAVAKGEQLEFYIDGKLVAEGKNNEFAAGKAGFQVSSIGGAVETLYDDFVMTGPEVKDGGHWNPKVHSQQSVEPQSKLATTWGNIKRNR
jgi:hypothetical protein